MSSKKERIEELETIVAELKEENQELNAAINLILKDIRDLQQFKRFVELAQAPRHRNIPLSVSNECVT
jgi:prefoldin subunit 5